MLRLRVAQGDNSLASDDGARLRRIAYMHAKTLTYQLELSNKLVEMNTRDVSYEEGWLRWLAGK
jgi:hypothetical protein